MRRWGSVLLLAGVLVLSSVSLSWSKDDATAKNKDLVRRVYEEAVNKGNFAVVDTGVDAAYVYHNDPALKGPSGVKSLIGMYRTAFPDMSLKVEDLVAEGDRVAVRWSATGTNKGALMGMDPTGKGVTISGMAFFRVAGGKIVEGWENLDGLAMMQQLGVVPMVGEVAK